MMCPYLLIGNGVCDQMCLEMGCWEHDGGDCEEGADPMCLIKCPEYWINDNFCDQHCVDMGCWINDGPDCGVQVSEDCMNCPEHWIGDNICDLMCLDNGCFEHDGGDCEEGNLAGTVSGVDVTAGGVPVNGTTVE
jgi:hypothetical protein